MKRIIIAFLLVFLSFHLQAQVQHSVGRGENVEDIAARYGVTVQDLIDLNPILKTGCFAGTVLTIPEKASASASAPVVDVDKELDLLFGDLFEMYDIWDKADELFRNKRYSRARHMYTRAIKMVSDEPALYYNRALCSYHLGNYRRALNDLYSCETLSPDEEMLESLREIRRIVNKRRDERAEAWGQVAVATLGAALMVGTAVAANSAAQSGYGMPAYVQPSYSDSYVLSEIAANRSSIYQTSAAMIAYSQQQQYINNMNFAAAQNAMIEDAQWSSDINNPVNKVFTSMFYYSSPDGVTPAFYANPLAEFREQFQEMTGRAPTAREEDLFNQKYMIMLSVEAGNTSNTTSEDSSVIESESHDENDSRYGWEDCDFCHHSGKCSTCNGNGWYFSSVTSDKLPCPNCEKDHNGKCAHCHGTGKRWALKGVHMYLP